MLRGYTNPKKESSMTNKRNQYTREFKLEAISLVTDHNRTIPDMADSLSDLNCQSTPKQSD